MFSVLLVLRARNTLVYSFAYYEQNHEKESLALGFIKGTNPFQSSQHLLRLSPEHIPSTLSCEQMPRSCACCQPSYREGA